MDIFQFRAILAPNIALKCKKNTPKNAENSSPTRGDLTLISKKTLSYFRRLLWEKLKKRRRRNFS